jgi:hypothetical protein
MATIVRAENRKRQQLTQQELLHASEKAKW